MSVIVVFAFATGLSACADKKDPPIVQSVDYSSLATNAYDVAETETTDYKLYMPEADGVNIGFIFYLGTAMSTSNYDYIMRKIASAGIAVYVPNNPFPDLAYKTDEKAYSVLKLSGYFIGGHSQGGGAAVRRAYENSDTTKGVILFSPLVSNPTTLADTSLPSVYFEAQNDYVLSASQRENAKSRMNAHCEYVLLNGAGHMCYGESNLLDGGGTVRDKREIQDEIAAKVIVFMQNALNG